MADDILPLPLDPNPPRIATKRCQGECHKTKPLSEFHYRPERGRYRAECKECYRKAADERRDPVDNRRRVKEWQKANPEKRAAQNKRRHENSRTDARRWLASNLRTTRAYAKEKRIECSLTADQLESMYQAQEGKCALTGRELVIGSKGQQRDSVSIDRIEPGGPYTLENVRLVTYQANMARGPYPDGELDAFCVARLTMAGYVVTPP